MLPKFIPLVFILCIACNLSDPAARHERQMQQQQNFSSENPYKRIADIPLPPGYTRENNEAGSFSEWLRKVTLKKNKTVYKYDGSLKFDQSAQFAVIDMPVGNKDLQQCADAVMRLRAEYFYDRKEYNKIIFTDNNGTAYQFHEPYTRPNFDKYLERVFGMCGSASLAKQLRDHIEMKNAEAGDVLIRGGFPGHAEIIMDVATDDRGNKI
jgi:hypothetical protein